MLLSCLSGAPSSDKEQLAEEEEDELKEVLDLRKIAVQLLQQEQQNRWETVHRHNHRHTNTPSCSALPHSISSHCCISPLPSYLNVLTVAQLSIHPSPPAPSFLISKDKEGWGWMCLPAQSHPESLTG